MTQSVAIRRAVLANAEAIRQVQSTAARGYCSADYTDEQMEAWTGGMKPPADGPSADRPADGCPAVS